ncbi:MAG: hypothetical protein K0Q97_1953 [Bacillota bacterium]|nr:hypothetical protein [Bacillota bacterium]
MNNCNISIVAPQKILKGAGLLNTSFLPSFTYQIKIIFKNQSDDLAICSFSSTLGNGIRFMNNIKHSGPDPYMLEKINVVEPNESIKNNNVILFANNFILSPNSTNIITFDSSLCDKYTVNSLENTGQKIPHESKIHFYGHLIYGELGEHVVSNSCESIACDYEILVSCEDSEVLPGEETKFYIQCRAGQYDTIKSAYLRCILDEGLEFIPDSSNIEPKKNYKFDKKTILKWDLGSFQPTEEKRIGYKVIVSSDLMPGSILINKFNTNCLNNSTYDQCPASCDFEMKVI